MEKKEKSFIITHIASCNLLAALINYFGLDLPLFQLHSFCSAENLKIYIKIKTHFVAKSFRTSL